MSHYEESLVQLYNHLPLSCQLWKSISHSLFPPSIKHNSTACPVSLSLAVFKQAVQCHCLSSQILTHFLYYKCFFLFIHSLESEMFLKLSVLTCSLPCASHSCEDKETISGKVIILMLSERFGCSIIEYSLISNRCSSICSSNRT